MNTKVNWINVIKMAGAFLAFMISSGFATGQETVQFYASYGIMSLGIALIALLLFCFVSSTLMGMGAVDTQGEVANGFNIFMGKRLGSVFEVIVRISLFFFVSTMVSGAGAALHEYFGVPHRLGTALMVLAIFVTLLFGFRRLIDILGFIGPVIVAFILLVGIINIVRLGYPAGGIDASLLEGSRPVAHWWYSGILYVGYNVFGGAPFLISLGREFKSKKDAKLGGIIGSIALMAACLCITLALLFDVEHIAGREVPTLVLVNNISPALTVVFAIVLLSGVYSAVTAMTWTVCEKISKSGTRKNKIASAIFCICAFTLSQFPFSRLLTIVYTASGQMGILMMLTLGFYLIRRTVAKKNAVETAESQI